MKEQQEQWTEVITGQHNWLNLKLKEVWKYRDLVRLFVWRDFVAAYKQTLLGPLWHFINPLMSTLIYTIIFGVIANIEMGGVPPFLFQLASVTFWGYFARCFSVTQITFLGNANIFGKVYFPRLTVPIAGIISSLIQLGIMLVIFFIAWIYYKYTGSKIHIAWEGVLILPILLIISSILGMGMGAIVAALTTKYRDLNLFVSYGISLLMYASAVVYPIAAIPEAYKVYVVINPIVYLMEGFRYAFLGYGILDTWGILYSAGVAVFVFLLGLIAFNITEKDFIDTV
ncbi:MAG: ABC transporter permease [Thermoflexibacter sp.]|jgi:lipopolysaccharide transport system permease protein|nr:ABC transporter permease [Thermoflexibacter sp.]